MKQGLGDWPLPQVLTVLWPQPDALARLNPNGLPVICLLSAGGGIFIQFPFVRIPRGRLDLVCLLEGADVVSIGSRGRRTRSLEF